MILIFLPHTNTVILLEPYCGTITEPGLPVISKLVSPQFLLFTLFCFREKNGEKTLQPTSINFVYMRLPDLQRIARIAMARCTREAKFEEVQRPYINIYQSNFLLCYIKFIPL